MDWEDSNPGKNSAEPLEAIHAFQSALLLEPTNNEAKFHLATCLQTPVVGKIDEARELYRQIIDEDVDRSLGRRSARGNWKGLSPLTTFNM